jgi:protein-tyrosine phosphatase
MYELFTEGDYEEYRSAASALGVAPLHIIDMPCSNFRYPTTVQVFQFVRTVRDENKAGRNVLVHCLSGVDRTGYMVAAYRLIVQLWTYKRAREEYTSQGQHWWYRWWIPSLRKYQAILSFHNDPCTV